MRKLLLLIVLLAGVSLQQGFGQACTPNPILVNIGLPGLYPNPLTTATLPPAEVGVPYSTVITVIVLGDTTIDLSPIVGFPVPTITAEVESQVIDSITGLPPGLTFACEPANCTIEGDSAGCIIIQGTPTAAGSYSPNVDTDLGLIIPGTIPVIGGTTQFIPIPGLTYELEVTDATVSIDDVNQEVLSVVSHGPNPFDRYTEIQYHAPKPGTISLQVSDLSGKIMAYEEHRAAAGQNTITWNRNGVASGIYFATLSNGESTATFKMTILD